MAEIFIENDWAAATTGSGTSLDPYNSLTDFVHAPPTVNPGDKITLAPGQSRFKEIFADGRRNGSTPWLVDVTINAAAKTITSTANNFAGGIQVFAAGHYFILQSVSGLNDGIYKIASVSGAGPYVITTTTELRVDESPGGKIRLAKVSASGIANQALPVVGVGTLANPIVYELNGNIIDPLVELNSANGYEWKQAGSTGSDAKKWYLVRKSTANAAGTDPMFVTSDLLRAGNNNRGYITVNGLRYDYSSNDNLYPWADLAASYAAMVNRQWWIGDNNSLGYSTVYIYWDNAALPSIGDFSSVLVRAPQSLYAINTGANTNGQGDFTHFTSSVDGSIIYGGGNDVVITTGSNTTKCMEISNVLLAYSANLGVNSSNGGKVLTRNVITYWTGHRGFGATENLSVIDIQNCIDYGSHLFGIISSGKTGTLIIRDSIGFHGEAGALDPNITVGVIDEAYNHFAPRFNGGGLNYASNNSRWTTTAATTNPPSLSTTGNTVSQVQDPKFVRVSDFGPELCDFHLGAGSPCIGSGIPLATNTTDKAGATYNVTAPNKGVYQSVGINGSGSFGGSSDGGLIGPLIS